MAMRLGDYLIRGELINLRRNSTYGTLELAGLESLVRFELTGNCAPDLFGKYIRFEPATPPKPDGDISRISWHLIGPVGDITAAYWAKTFDCSIEEFVRRSKLGEAPPTYWARRFYFEFYCQHGRVVIELAGPKLEYDAGDGDEEDWQPLPETTAKPTEEDGQRMMEEARLHGPSITMIHESGEVEEIDCSERPEFDVGDELDAFQRSLDREASAVERAVMGGGDDDGELDENELIEEMRVVDELYRRSGGEPLVNLFVGMRLPPVDKVTEEEAGPLVKGLLAQMAMYCVALHVCEHYTMRDTYRLIRKQMATEWTFRPDLRGVGFTQNYMTSEYCDKCEAEMDAKYPME